MKRILIVLGFLALWSGLATAQIPVDYYYCVKTLKGERIDSFSVPSTWACTSAVRQIGDDGYFSLQVRVWGTTPHIRVKQHVSLVPKPTRWCTLADSMLLSDYSTTGVDSMFRYYPLPAYYHWFTVEGLPGNSADTRVSLYSFESR